MVHKYQTLIDRAAWGKGMTIFLVPPLPSPSSRPFMSLPPTLSGSLPGHKDEAETEPSQREQHLFRVLCFAQ